VAILSIGVYVAVGWTAAKLSETRVNNANLVRQLDEKSTTLNQALSDKESYRTQRDQAQQAAARSEGELSATKAALVAAKKPTTQPGLWGIFAKTPAD
jgi:hypothetical protein